MPGQINPKRFRYNISIDCMSAAKVRTLLKGKTKDAKPSGKRKVRSPLRKLTMSDWCESLIEEKIANVKPDAESISWMTEILNNHIRRRKGMDRRVKAGEFCKPVELRQKTGPKKGNPSPKFLAAMKKLGEERRARRDAALKKAKGSK